VILSSAGFAAEESQRKGNEDVKSKTDASYEVSAVTQVQQDPVNCEEDASFKI